MTGIICPCQTHGFSFGKIFDDLGIDPVYRGFGQCSVLDRLGRSYFKRNFSKQPYAMKIIPGTKEIHLSQVLITQSRNNNIVFGNIGTDAVYILNWNVNNLIGMSPLTVLRIRSEERRVGKE